MPIMAKQYQTGGGASGGMGGMPDMGDTPTPTIRNYVRALLCLEASCALRPHACQSQAYVSDKVSYLVDICLAHAPHMHNIYAFSQDRKGASVKV
jgi:hypothetical protein